MRTSTYTFKELFAGILLEECFMLHDWLVEIVNHELEDRLDLLFGIASIVGQGGILHVLAYAQ